VRRVALVLAAGEGTRMKSRKPKVMHRACGKPMISWVLDTLEEIRDQGYLDRVLVVIGNGAEEVREEVAGRASCLVQEERKGTGHAVMIAAPFIEEDEALILPGDSPLISARTLIDLCELHRSKEPAVTILSTMLDDPYGYGRITRNGDGEVMGIVEETEATPEERKIKEVNSSMYVFRWQALKGVLSDLSSDNAKKEYFLTDTLGLLIEAGEHVAACITPDYSEVLGVNSREQLALVEALMRERINRRWMEEGVTMEDPSSTYIGGEVEIGMDTILRPQVMLEGRTLVGEDCVLGPGVRIVDSRLGNRVVVEQAKIIECELEDGVNVGPYASLRPGSHLGAGSKAGTFVETKKTVVGKGSKIPHLSYMGDAEIGDGVNVGAGSITCNYDGAEKHPTVIEDEAFIGSDTMFIAPVRIGKGAVTGAGSAIAKDVPAGALGVERSSQKNILEWKKRSKDKNKSKKDKEEGP
jgi:bifunctional UDP-N-acetylglucosamine pyrophosphorylase / glucosamine-1-phosphate N-acetyltransferase